LNGFVNIPAAFCPVSGGDANEDGQVGGPCVADGANDFKDQAGAVQKAAAVGIGALVGEWG
jgi:hypothetical protein